MKNYIILSIIALTAGLLLPGCITKPKAIDDVYLSEVKQEDADKLRKIEENIVVLKKNRDKTESDLAIAEQLIVVTEAEISVIKETKSFLQDREILFSITGEKTKFLEAQENLKKNEQEIKDAKDRLKLNEAERDEVEALLAVRKAELAVKIAELDYEKAKAAKIYQSKRPEMFGKENIIDETDYKNFYDKLAADLIKKVEKHRKARDVVEKLKSGDKASK